MRARPEDGQIGGVEAVVFGVLVFVFGTLLVANTWAVIDAKMAASAAAREGARAFVEAASRSEGAQRADQAARQAILGYGRDPERLSVATAGLLERCASVTVTVAYPVPVAGIPVLGRRAGTITVTASHAEVVDPYRSGLPLAEDQAGAGADPCPAGGPS